jgi:hypothetical protein
LSLPSTTVVSRTQNNSRQINPGNSKSESSAGNGNSPTKTNNNKSKPMSKRQKLLRKRFEEQKNLAAEKAAEKSRQIAPDDCDELDQEDVKVKYSIVYFNWAVSDSEDSDSEDNPDKTGNGNGKQKIHRNITLPLRKMRLKN